MEKKHAVSKNKTELIVAQIMNFLLQNSLKLKTVRKTTRPFKYDLNQILYTVKVTNRFKGLDLIHRVHEQLWTEVHNTGGRNQYHPQEKEMQKGKMVV